MSTLETPRLLSLQVGLPRDLGTPDAADPMDRPWRSAVFKEPVTGQVWLSRTNLEGDEQADLKAHGGPDKAVMVNAAAHYPLWRDELDLPEIPYGGLGENFTVASQTEADVCLGDIYAVGDARVQVAQPRQPCWKMSRRLGVRDLSVRIQTTGRTGWYLRVLNEGKVAAGDHLILLERPYPQWSIARINEVLYNRPADLESMAQLVELPVLADRLRQTLTKLLALKTVNDRMQSLMGPNIEG